MILRLFKEDFNGIILSSLQISYNLKIQMAFKFV